MSEAWKQKALEIDKTLQEAVRKHPELAPLCTSFANFAKKHQLNRKQDDVDALRTLLERHGLVIMPKQNVDRLQATISSQAEEIKALEHRIATLLRP